MSTSFGASPLDNHPADGVQVTHDNHKMSYTQHSFDHLNQIEEINLPIHQINERVLSLSERARIKKTLFEAKSELESLENKISRTQDLLSALLAERDQRTSRIETMAAAIAPHKHLPSEILSEIMALSASGQEVYLPPAMRPGTAFAWGLTRVCSRWRQIALNEPRIWTKISFYDGCTVPEFIGASEEVFRRSGQAPLCLFLALGRQEMHPTNPIHSFLAPNLGRISTLSFSNLPPSFMTDFLSLPTSLLIVKEVSLACRKLFQLPKSKIRVFEDASQLVNLSIQGRPEDMTDFPCNLNIQWHNLVEIHFSELPVSPYNTHKMLSQCSQLKSCFMEVGEGQETNILLYPPGSIRLPLLDEMRITDSRSSGSSIFLPLVLPAISTLTIGDSLPGGTVPLADSLHRSSSPIKELTLHSATNEDLGPLVENVSSLVRLTASGCELRMPTIDKVNRRECAPSLQRLDCRIDRDIANAFFDMLERRWEGEVGFPRERQTFSWLRLTIRGADDDLLGHLYGRRDEMRKRFGPRLVSMW
jgi:hypothetical protein